MIASAAATSPSISFLAASIYRRPSHLSSLFTLRALDWKKRNQPDKNRSPRDRRGRGGCRAELAQDAPFAVAIGASVLNSIVFPVPPGGPNDGDEGGDGAVDSTDARFAVMGVISFIPYFNWMGWVFAWLDSGRARYLVYAIVYLAPYLRTNLSLSTEESWLPIASILFCVIHVQLEASIRNGDLYDIQFFYEARKLFAQKKKERQLQNHQGFSKGRSMEHVEPCAQELREEFLEGGIPKKPVDDHGQLLNEDSGLNAKENESDLNNG